MSGIFQDDSLRNSTLLDKEEAKVAMLERRIPLDIMLYNQRNL